MDQEHFAGIIKEFPQVWDRSHPHFKDKMMKEKCWTQISDRCGHSELICKDTFKALREKYLREREKAKYLGDSYVPWKLLDMLSFLEPHIIPRKQSANHEETIQTAEELSSSYVINKNDTGYQNFEINLIQLVKQSAPIWDRNSKTFSSKQLKTELWKNIAQKLHKDPDYCILRWKALREKYIRQKVKYQEGEGQWHLLDRMSFLDEVIQYRRKRSLCDMSLSPHNDNSMTPSFPESLNKPDIINNVNNTYNEEAGYFHFDSEGSVTDSNNDFLVPIKNEEPSDVPDCGKAQPEIPDSSNEVASSNTARKRYCSSECDNEHSAKQTKHDGQPLQQQTQEQLFGNLVALMLSKKSERDKNIAMVEIMKILTN